MKMVLWCVSLWGLLGALASPAYAQAPVAAPTPEYVVLKRAQPLYQAPSKKAAKWLDPTYNAKDANEVPYWAWRVRGEQGGWVEVESDMHSAVYHHCYDKAPYGLSNMALRFFVPSKALVPVTTEHTKITYQDGTNVSLSSGVALKPLGGKRYEAWTMHFKFNVTLSKGVGTRYTRTRPIFWDDHTQGERWRSDITHKLGGFPVEFSRPGWGVKVRENKALGNRRMLVSAASVCAYFQALAVLPPREKQYAVNNPVIANILGSMMGGGGGGGPLIDTVTVKAGAPVFWSDGQRAGIAIGEHEFIGVPEIIKGRRCVAAALAGEAGPANKSNTLLCFEKADAAVAQRQSGMGFGSAIGSANPDGGFDPNSKPMPGVDFGATRVTQGALPSRYSWRILGHIDALSACYFGLRKAPEGQGRVVLKFKVGTDGSHTIMAVLKDELKEPEVMACVVEHLSRATTLPRPSAETIVEQEIIFTNP